MRLGGLRLQIAKQPGRRTCAGLRILVRRLPRIATDQTLSVTPYPAANALEVMLEIARELD